jgi:hypothetical protein
MFLDPERPLTTCTPRACSECPARAVVHCHFQARDLVRFLAVALPLFLVGGAGIWRVGTAWLVGWLAACLGFFGLVEIRVLCSHCPHYAEPGRILRCWANYGSPKLWRYRPGPLSRAERTVFLSGLMLVFGLPLPFMLAGGQRFLLLLYSLAGAGLWITMQRTMCSVCMNFACPFNRVGEVGRQTFWKTNPQHYDARCVEER